MANEETLTGWKDVLFKKKYPLWVLLAITLLYAIIFYISINSL